MEGLPIGALKGLALVGSTGLPVQLTTGSEESLGGIVVGSEVTLGDVEGIDEGWPEGELEG